MKKPTMFCRDLRRCFSLSLTAHPRDRRQGNVICKLQEKLT